MGPNYILLESIKNNTIMKIFTTTVFFLCIYALDCHAQGNLINQSIQQARNAGEKFEITSALTSISSRSASQNNRIQDQFINPQEVYILHYDQSAARNFGSSMTLQLPLGSQTMQLELREVEMGDVVVTTSSGQTLPPNKNIRNYHGVV